jgi:hypothetical protein
MLHYSPGPLLMKRRELFLAALADIAALGLLEHA